MSKTGGFALAGRVFSQLFPALLDARGPNVGLVESLAQHTYKVHQGPNKRRQLNILTPYKSQRMLPHAHLSQLVGARAAQQSAPGSSWPGGLDTCSASTGVLSHKRLARREVENKREEKRTHASGVAEVPSSSEASEVARMSEAHISWP